ncbi:MAG: curlin [Flavobacteriaceae bacterium]|nr:curlin [Flavobacteriaceae bacterium]|tara:strand:+ start:9804 stop:11294 length:1491 start_codon:yes stop_codon:yes gene_type:complete
MKKLMLCAIALMFTAVGFSQVTDSNGNSSPTATTVPNLSADPDANTGLSIQNGNDNKVRVRQAGTSQSVYTNQDNGSGIGGNQARVMQTGAVSSASGVMNRADVLQSGSTNQSTTKQEGDTNDAVTRQGQDNDASANNRALIRQGVANQAESNYAAIDQDGDGNWAQTQQTYDNSDAWTQQTGNENKSMINQDAGPNGTDGHYAMNEQEGDRNESFIGQSGAGARNSARALQVGNDNQSKQMQVATDVSGGTGNDAGVVQGEAGIARRTAVASEADAQWSSIIANVYSTGSLPLYAPTQGNKAKQTQVGAGNSAGMMQYGGDVGASNYGEQEQVGDGNAAGMVQTHYYPGDDSNYSKQLQVGNSNTAGLVVAGSGHKAFQNQDGDSNTALSYQAGKDQKLNTHQFGADNVAYSTQMGADNAALIVQYDGQSYTVEQNAGAAFGDFSVGGNQADILQMGPDGDFGAGAVDCDFDDPMNLDMDYEVPSFNLGDICDGC